MEIEVTAYFPALTIGDQTYDFAHLEPFNFTIASQLAKRDLRVHVTFSSHCFSQGYDAATHPAREPIIPLGAAMRRSQLRATPLMNASTRPSDIGRVDQKPKQKRGGLPAGLSLAMDVNDNAC